MGSRVVSVAALSRLTGASPVTIRRDLADLEGHGLVRRVHGGALAVPRRGAPQPYALRASENAEGKAAIARAICDLVEDDMSIVLDNGSTVVAVAEALAGRPLTALCMSLRSAIALGTAGGSTIVTPRGAVTAESLRYTGAACVEALEGFRADVAVLGTCSASHASGLTVTTFEDAQIKRAVLGVSVRAIVAATGDKLVRTSSFRFGSLEDIDDLVTTSDAPDGALDEFRAAGVRVHAVDVPDRPTLAATTV